MEFLAVAKGIPHSLFETPDLSEFLWNPPVLEFSASLDDWEGVWDEEEGSEEDDSDEDGFDEDDSDEDGFDDDDSDEDGFDEDDSDEDGFDDDDSDDDSDDDGGSSGPISIWLPSIRTDARRKGACDAESNGISLPPHSTTRIFKASFGICTEYVSFTTVGEFSCTAFSKDTHWIFSNVFPSKDTSTFTP